MAFDPDMNLILGAYETDDDIGKILRCHLVIERQVDQLIALCSRAKVDRRTTFWAKMNLFRAMRVPEQICVACEALNDLRNLFAHNSEATMPNTKSTSDAFLNAMENRIPILPQSHGTFHRRKQQVEHSFTYADADQGQRVVVASAYLSSLIGVLPKLYHFDEPPRIAALAGFNI